MSKLAHSNDVGADKLRELLYRRQRARWLSMVSYIILLLVGVFAVSVGAWLLALLVPVLLGLSDGIYAWRRRANEAAFDTTWSCHQ